MFSSVVPIKGSQVTAASAPDFPPPSNSTRQREEWMLEPDGGFFDRVGVYDPSSKAKSAKASQRNLEGTLLRINRELNPDVRKELQAEHGVAVDRTYGPSKPIQARVDDPWALPEGVKVNSGGGRWTRNAGKVSKDQVLPSTDRKGRDLGHVATKGGKWDLDDGSSSEDDLLARMNSKMPRTEPQTQDRRNVGNDVRKVDDKPQAEGRGTADGVPEPRTRRTADDDLDRNLAQRIAKSKHYKNDASEDEYFQDDDDGPKSKKRSSRPPRPDRRPQREAPVCDLCYGTSAFEKRKSSRVISVGLQGGVYLLFEQKDCCVVKDQLLLVPQSHCNSINGSGKLTVVLDY